MIPRCSTVRGYAYLVKTLLVFTSLVSICRTESFCLQNPDDICQTCTKGSNYDRLTNCSTCVEPRVDPAAGCNECMQGEPKCHNGNFTFSALFHSYLNLRHLCAECSVNGPVCCDSLEQTSCIDDCLLRLMYIVQPFGATTFDFNIPRQRPVIQSDNISMFEQGPNSFNSSNWSNPYTLEMETWTERLQFYIVVHDFNRVTGNRSAIDRFLINLTFGPAPKAIPRQTYHGIYNISQFDLSFSIGCSDNYYGSLCNIFCYEVGEYTCDVMGNKVCADEYCSISTDCQECTTQMITTSSLPNAFYGGVMGVVMLLVIFAITIIIFLICRQKKIKRPANNVVMMGECETCENTFAEETHQKICPTDMQGEIPVTNGIMMEGCVAYEHTQVQEPVYQEIDQIATQEEIQATNGIIEVGKCVAYGHNMTSQQTQEIHPIATQEEVYDNIYDN